MDGWVGGWVDGLTVRAISDGLGKSTDFVVPRNVLFHSVGGGGGLVDEYVVREGGGEVF